MYVVLLKISGQRAIFGKDPINTSDGECRHTRSNNGETISGDKMCL